MDLYLSEMMRLLEKFNNEHPEVGRMAYVLFYEDGSGHVGWSIDLYDHIEIDLETWLDLNSK